MPGKYAATTTVPVEKSEIEVKQTLRRYDIEDIATLSRSGLASIMFSKDGRTFRFSLEVPPLGTLVRQQIEKHAYNPDDPQQWEREEAEERAAKEWNQEGRRIWRVLIMVLKAHFEIAEEIGVDEAFASHIVLPSGETVAEYMLPRLDYATSTGVLPDPFADLMPKRLAPPSD